MGRAPCCDKANVKKGPWSPDEDAKLRAFIEQNGTGGNWITLPSKAGLKRCGKSCRLRWINYLRPDIKHGSFTEDEEKMIYELHANIGSRWSLIAAQLPGRTDNDIKNYWNTRLKKKLSSTAAAAAAAVAEGAQSTKTHHHDDMAPIQFQAFAGAAEAPLDAARLFGFRPELFRYLSDHPQNSEVESAHQQKQFLSRGVPVQQYAAVKSEVGGMALRSFEEQEMLISIESSLRNCIDPPSTTIPSSMMLQLPFKLQVDPSSSPTASSSCSHLSSERSCASFSTTSPFSESGYSSSSYDDPAVSCGLVPQLGLSSFPSSNAAVEFEGGILGMFDRQSSKQHEAQGEWSSKWSLAAQTSSMAAAQEQLGLAMGVGTATTYAPGDPGMGYAFRNYVTI